MSPSKFSYGLMTDLYQLTMAAGYFNYECVQPATFELFIRRLPSVRNYLVVAGLSEILDYITDLRFAADEIDYLCTLPAFKNIDKEFFNYLKGFRFTGDIWAMPEGTIAFAEEPLLRVTAPLIEAQLIETYLLSVLNFQTMVATKASRIVSAASSDGKERAVFEFGTRRAHGPVAGSWAARSAYIGGCTGTSNVAAGHSFGIPVFGTAAHAWTLAFDDEETAFENFYQLYPETTTLLIDTYDTLRGAANATKLGPDVKGVRIDSGDLLVQSREVRKILDNGGLNSTKIVVSGDLNEYSITKLIDEGAPIDTFGVGTELVTSRDAPALGGVYKMVERIDHNGVRHQTAKFSLDKITLPGVKQVFRHISEDGKYLGDTIALAQEEAPQGAIPLLQPVMQQGQLIKPRNVYAELVEARERATQGLISLPKDCRQLNAPRAYPIHRSKGLETLLAEVKEIFLAKASITN